MSQMSSPLFNSACRPIELPANSGRLTAERVNIVALLSALHCMSRLLTREKARLFRVSVTVINSKGFGGSLTITNTNLIVTVASNI